MSSSNDAPSNSSSSSSPPSPSQDKDSGNDSGNNSGSPPSPTDSGNNSGKNDSGNSSSSSPPPPTPDSAPPPQKSENQSPPPPSSDNKSPPPPQKSDGNDSSPPQSSNNNNNNDNNNNNNNNNNNDNNNNNNNNNSPPPPPKDSSSGSSPSNDSSGSSPSNDSSSPSNNNSKSPPPHHSSNSNSPPHKQLSPPNSGDKNEGSSSKSDHSNGEFRMEEHMPLIIGVTVGVVAFLIIMILIFVACSKKKKRRNEPMHYYMDTGPKGSASGYYHSSQHQTWQNSQMDHVIKMNQSGMSSGPPNGWLQPPPPPPGMTSSDMSSAYSGPRQPVLPPPSPNVALGFNQSTFTYEEIAQATNGFSQANLLGQGGFGYVHKGVLPNGKVVAVKSLKSGSGQGEREFQAEVDIISRVHHRHLVSLVGYCIAGGQRMLVYEFVPNNTLEYHLHGKGRPVMEWSKRVTIAMGAAKGLAYLHEDCHPRIIHRDIKTANILIDDNWEAMVADFGLAKLNDTNVTHVSTRVMGTFGYLAPEYASSGKLTEKSDVFSYGVMLLELITGRRPVDTTDQYMEDSLVDWARPILTRAIGDGDYEELIDPRLEDNYDPNELARMVACASASVRHSAKRRPKMSQIVRALEGDVSLDDLNEPVRGATSSSSDYDTVAYNADMKKFRNMALNSQEYTSSEYGANTGDFGRKNSTSSGSEVFNSREIGRSKRG